MAIKKNIFFTFIVLIIAHSYSQITIRPFLGVSSSWSRAVKIEGNIENENFLSDQNYGIEIDKKFKRNAFGFSAKNTSLSIGAGVIKKGSLKEYYRRHQIGAGMLNLGLFYGYDLVSLNRRNYSIDFPYKPIMVIQPIIGINFLKSEKNINWYGGTINIGGETDSTSYVNSKAIVLEKDEWNVSKFVDKAFYGYSLNVGFFFHVYSKRKEVIAFRVQANLGIKDMLKTEYVFREKYPDGSVFEASGTFASRGSNFTVDMSIPFTLIHKKGERWKDLH